MINVKSNGNGKSITENDDLSFQSMTITPSDDTPFSSVTNDFFTYNKYVGIFEGIMNMKAGTVHFNEALLTLPVKPINTLNILAPSIVGQDTQLKTIVIETSGVVRFLVDNEFSTNDRVSLSFSFPIQIGGGFLTFFKKLRAFFLSKEVSYA